MAQPVARQEPAAFSQRPACSDGPVLTGAQALVQALAAEGVDTVFGYPGGASLPIYDAIYDSESIRHVLVRHEQGAIHAAEGYARATGKVGVCLATSGPGATNLVTGLCDALMDSIPIVAITGQVASSALGSDAFQEADVTGITMPVTKHNYLVRDVRDLPRIIKEAFHIASTGRPGPVLIDIPKDVANAEVRFVYPAAVDLPGYKPTVDGHPAQIKRAAALINRAERPYLYVGGGAVAGEAGALVRELAEKAQIPVTTTLMGLGVFPGDHPLFVGMPGMHGTVTASRCFQNCDVLIAVGVRFDDRVTGKLETFAPQCQIIHIDIDPAEIGKNKEAHVPIVGDAGRVLAELVPQVKEAGTAGVPAREPWLETVRGWKEQFPLDTRPGAGARPRAQEIIRRMSALLPEDAIISVDVGQHQMWTAQHYTFRHPRTWLSSSGLGTMGFGLPAAMGAAMAHPDRAVWCVTGDGSYQMCLQEMATIVENGLPVKVMLLNNGFLGMVRQWQEMFHGHRYSQVHFKQNPDFVKLAEAYGWAARRLERREDVDEVIRWALAEPGPVLIDALIEEETNVFPMVPAGASIDDIIVGEDDAV